DNALLARLEIAGDVAVVLLAVGRGHQHADSVSKHGPLGVAEEPLSRSVKRLNHALFANDNGRVRNGVQDGTQVRLACLQFVRVPLAPDPGAAELLAEPRDTPSHRDKDEGFENRRFVKVAKADQQDAKRCAKEGGEKPGTQSSEARGNHYGRDEDQERGAVLEPGMQAPACQQHEADSTYRRPIMDARANRVVDGGP